MARRTFAALRSDNIYFEADDFVHEHTVRLRRWDEQGNLALAALNFGEPRTVTMDLPNGGIWRDVVGDCIYHMDGGAQQFALDAWQGLLLVPVYVR